MKKTIFLCLIFFLSLKIKAQNEVNVSLSINPPYSPYYADYVNFGSQNLLQLTNNTNNTFQVKLVGSITGLDNGLTVYTNENYQPASPIVLAPFQVFQVNNSSPSRNFLDPQNTTNNLSAQQQTAITTSGLLPEGTYQICVRAVDYLTGAPLSDEFGGCTIITIAYPVPPILIQPSCEAVVENPLPNFSWTSLHVPGSFFLYDLYILKLVEGQNATDAMWLAIGTNVGNPIAINNNVANSYQYKPYDIPLQNGAKYAWCVVARDASSKVVIANGGRSEVCTFTYQIPVVQTPVTPVLEEEPPTAPQNFNLNNTTVSGKLLYRYRESDVLNLPETPLYNPVVQIGGTPVNEPELLLLAANAPGGTPANPTLNGAGTQAAQQGNNGLNSNPGFHGNWNANTLGQLLGGNSSRIGIDPQVKYLYNTLLPNLGSEPLHNTSVSLYLEYVAFRQVKEGNTTYFEVIPGADMYYNKKSISVHGQSIDPQMDYIAAANGSGAQNPMIFRPYGSELIATTSTDADGNFSFNFDLLENTGLLANGPVKLLSHRFNKPEVPAEEQQFVNPLDMVSNPMLEVTSPVQNNGNPGSGLNISGEQSMFGNVLLQGNAGWSGVNTNLNGALQNLGNQGAIPGGAGLQNQINQKGGPSMPDLFSVQEEPITFIEYNVFYLFKVLRIKVNNPLYASPDVLIFAQPGSAINIPPTSTYVNSYTAKLKVLAGGKTDEKPFINPGDPLSNFAVKIARRKSFWESKPENFPLHEGMDLLPEQYFSIQSNTPYFVSWNQSKEKPNQLKLTSTETSKANGEVEFRRLVSNVNSGNGDEHLFEIEMPKTGDYNYSGSWGSFKHIASLPGHMSEAVHSYNFYPPVFIVEVKLEPLAPEILLRSVTKSNIETVPLAGVEVYMQEYNRNGNQFLYSSYAHDLTDANGYKRFANLTMGFGEQGLINPYRRVFLYKNGYPIKYLPNNDANHNNNAQNFYPPIKKGQRLDLGEVLMQGSANVFGYVKDEDDNAVMALVKIGDGPFFMTGMTNSKAGYNSKVHRTVPAETLPLTYALPSDGFNLMDQGAFQGLFNGSQSNNQNPQALSGNFPMSNPGAGGVVVATSPGLAQFAEQVSRFQAQAAATGSNTRVIVIPMSDQYIPDTFYVNVPVSQTPVDIGTFMVFEKAHRVKVLVKRNGPVVANQVGYQPAPNALVEIGDYAKTTASNGVALFRFTTPDAFFRVFVKDGNRVPIEEYRNIPISKHYTVIEYSTDAGMTISGTVTNKANGQPIAGARVFYEHSSTVYGPTLIETTTNGSGQFTLSGLPLKSLTIRATKADEQITWIGSAFTVRNPSPNISGVSIKLEAYSGPSITKIYGFPVELNELTPLPDGKVKVAGAFVQVPANGNFKLFDPTQRVRFSNVILKPGTVNNQAAMVPDGQEVNTLESSLRLRLHNAFLADLRPYQTSFIPRIKVREKRLGVGGFYGRVQTDLETFRFSFDYSGKFYLGELASEPAFFPLVSNGPEYTEREYFLMDLAPNGTVKPIAFSIHNFAAKADLEASRLVKDTVKIVTSLFPEIPLAGDLEVKAGTIRVTPSTIIIGAPGEELSFKLETWTVKSTQSWAYSIPLGGILIPKALIQTQMADIPVSDLILRPTQLIMPQANIDLNNLSLGGGVTKLHQYPNNQAVFNFDVACSYDLGPHWRFSLYPDNPDDPACYVKNLPGFANEEKINIGAFTIFSNNSTLIQPVYQTRRFSNIADLNIFSITNTPNSLEVTGGVDLAIPGMTTPTMVLEFTKPSGQNIVRRVKAMDVALETPGKVYFSGDPGAENYIFSDGKFETTGTLKFENDNLSDGKLVQLRGYLMKNTSGGILEIPKLQNNDSPQAFQYIPLSGGDSKLKILQGDQNLQGGAWNTMAYTADLIGPEGLTNDKTLDYLVVGAMEVDASSGNSIKVDKIDTPLGGMSMVFDWEQGIFIGTLEINVPITISTVTLNSGLMEVCAGGKGFYFDMIGNVSLPGLSAIGDLNVGILVGYYPELPQMVIDRHKDIMFLLDVPEYLHQDGIAGIYCNANFSPPVANWSHSVTIPILPPITVGAGVSMGADLNYLLNFGAETMVMQIQAGAYAKAWAGVDILVCEFCVGALAKFLGTGTLVIAPKASAELDACASLTMFGSFCGGELDVTAGCKMNMSTQGGVNFDLIWSPCGGPAKKSEMSCEF